MPCKRVRAVVCFTPVWVGTIRNYALKFIHQNRWRCDRIHEIEDLEQDAHLIFIKISTKYPRVVEERHFMGLFKVALANNFHDRALYMKRKRVLEQDTSQDVSELYTGRIGELSNGGYVGALLAEAPEELQIALQLIANNPEMLKTPRHAKRENLNAKIRRVLGTQSVAFEAFYKRNLWRSQEMRNYDFVGEIKALLS